MLFYLFSFSEERVPLPESDLAPAKTLEGKPAACTPAPRTKKVKRKKVQSRTWRENKLQMLECTAKRKMLEDQAASVEAKRESWCKSDPSTELKSSRKVGLCIAVQNKGGGRRGWLGDRWSWMGRFAVNVNELLLNHVNQLSWVSFYKVKASR